MINQIFNEDNMETMKRMDSNSVDGVISSPPYNISSKRKDMYYNTGYSDIDNHTPEQYLEIRVNEFKEFQRIIKDDRVVFVRPLSYTTYLIFTRTQVYLIN
jgi:DNA modification methylase